MIHVRLAGGLGNQLFQYAAGRALALRRGTGLLLDTRELGRGGPAHSVYGLHHFAIEARIARDADLPPDRSRPLAHLLWRRFGRNPRFLRERGLGLNSAVLDAPDGTYLHGYFQSEAYFSDALPALRHELSIVTAPSAENAGWLARIAADGDAVSLHMRRGDYVSDAKGATTHGTCDAAHYRRAIAALTERTGRTPSLYVFSDDPDWVRTNLDLGLPMHVPGHNGPDVPHEDLRLMSACRHHIIANSTFSWWAAWLDPRPDAITIAPRRWFANPSLSNPDILPARWIAV
ncbi:alpha-1,2-fucosyltransferase [Rhodobacteraceae bacterium HSP-20]|uniref:Alpha-1,2-fucosyltransferase n=1 Tax=Paragemmobacter amnigenus TaxID=2852097 RepID=A0ABS6J3R1_9RHOB|nr:alpha-1,2-fucosyltransferase [Rhodobacter amnigenus]MBU9698238.1 alpha-1,2-fucosyltransferase [Rhodobacter amnigenus]MBV4389465.1 alpha-1,2-fucosyltransferase [Rhodobacter amnigenus]